MKFPKMDNLTKTPLMLLLTVIVVIILLVGIFRSIAPYLSLGFGAYARVGDVRGAVSFETFENSDQPTFTMFYAPWCGHCKTAHPEFVKLKETYKGNVKMMDVNGDEDKEAMKKHGIQGFPTMRYYPNGMSDMKNFKEYSGNRTESDMKEFLDSQSQEGFRKKKNHNN
jgi:protein disulfide-isomerase A6